MVCEEGADGPDDGENGDNEEDEDGVGGQSVVLDIDVHEVCEHAHGWDLVVVRSSTRKLLAHGGLLTKVRISRKRQKTKSTPYIIFAIVDVV